MLAQQYHRITDDVDMVRLELGLHDAHDPRLVSRERWKLAEQEGIDRAQSEGCDYWKDHPEDVVELRRRVEGAWPHGGR
jgi:hypothetical protein